MKLIKQLFFICIFISLHKTNAITLVYNMKIRRSFAAGRAFAKKKKSYLITSAVPVVYKRDRHIIDDRLHTNVSDKRINGGSLINIRFIQSKKWWLEATTGIETEHAKIKGTSNFSASRTGFDDVVLSGGFNIFPTKDIQLDFYGLAGFPTRTKVTLKEAQDTLVGTRFYSAGIGSEISYSPINTLPQSLILVFQNRFIHFFNRKWTPILPPDAKIQPGNLTDLLFAANYRHKTNIFETGYNPTFFTNQAVLLKTETINGRPLIRNSFYINYAHLFKKFILERPGLIGTGLIVSRAKRFNTKIISFLINLTVIF